MVEIHKKSKCTGCGACINVCPTSAIEMVADAEGFSYPTLNDCRCTGCGKCRKICPISSENRKALAVASQKLAYLCAINDPQLRQASSSGGIFYALALKCLEDGGVVFGAKFDESWNVVHASATNEEGIKEFQVSKYVQSNIEGTYREAKAVLDLEKPVLFAGTPCQIAGLKSFLGKVYSNLLTCDFICHGVPSPAVWRDYVAYREEKAGAKAVKIFFRVKVEGWLKGFFFFLFSNRTEYRQYKEQDIYYKGFLNNLFVRPCCHHCSFKGYVRMADITVADAWGIKEYAPEFYNEKGVSFIIIHTDKGKSAFESVHNTVTSQTIEINKPIRHNPNFFCSEVCSLRRNRFFSDWKSKGIEAAIERNLKFYDKLFRKGISIVREIPSYVWHVRSRRL